MSAIVLIFGLLAVCAVLQHVGVDRTAGESVLVAGGCKPISESLFDAATLSDRPGEYGLTLVEVAGDSPERSALGTLTLRPHKSELDSLRSVSTPLYGFSDIDLQSVGAYRVGDPGSEDPDAPGVLVLESDRDGRRVIILRLGSEANRRDRVRYDGAYMVLEVQRIDEDGFAGSWRSGFPMSGTRSRTRGYFCAIQVPQ